MEIVWEKDVNKKCVDKDSILVEKELTMWMTPMSPHRSGIWKTMVRGVPGGDNAGDIFKNIDMRWDSWNGDSVAHKYSTSEPDQVLASIETDIKRRICIRNKYKLSYKKNPFFFFTCRNLTQKYSLEVNCRPNDLLAFFWEEVDFQNMESANSLVDASVQTIKRERRGLLIPGQSHCITLHRV